MRACVRVSVSVCVCVCVCARACVCVRFTVCVCVCVVGEGSSVSAAKRANFYSTYSYFRVKQLEHTLDSTDTLAVSL